MLDLPTPCLVIDAQRVRANLRTMAEYVAAHSLHLRPHTKTHKCRELARLQLTEGGATGLTVAKVGEAQVMAEVTGDLLLAFPTVDARRCAAMADLARTTNVRVAVDSPLAVNRLAEAAVAAGSTVGVLVDLDVGLGRTGVQSPAQALALAQAIDGRHGLRLDGIMFFPGHVSGPDEAKIDALRLVCARVAETLDQWRRSGLRAAIVSGGSTPTALLSHHVKDLTEIRPGTYFFNDMNCVRGGCATLDDCAARIVATVISTAVPGQVVLDAGSKTLTSDLCGPAPQSGHGHIVEHPGARIVKLSEEHAQVDVSGCQREPTLGEQVTIIPNHICPWLEPGQSPRVLKIDARGKVF
ncbi:MAG: alanine racemase [Planctomycetia bacterium]|nr:alanine racemase [Planctomycetia bacterium]